MDTDIGSSSVALSGVGAATDDTRDEDGVAERLALVVVNERD